MYYAFMNIISWVRWCGPLHTRALPHSEDLLPRFLSTPLHSATFSSCFDVWPLRTLDISIFYLAGKKEDAVGRSTSASLLQPDVGNRGVLQETEDWPLSSSRGSTGHDTTYNFRSCLICSLLSVMLKPANFGTSIFIISTAQGIGVQGNCLRDKFTPLRA